jgi:hypothetical protein
MSFSFGFDDDDDIEKTDEEMRDAPTTTTVKPALDGAQSEPAAETARSHNIAELVCDYASKLPDGLALIMDER